MDYTGVVVGGLIGLIGSCIAAIVAILIAKANIDAAEVRRHEELKREAYPRLLFHADVLRDTLLAALEHPNEPQQIDGASLMEFRHSAVQVDLLGTQEVSTNARALRGKLDDLLRFVTQGGDPLELPLLLSAINVHKTEFVNAARLDLGRPTIELLTPAPWSLRPPTEEELNAPAADTLDPSLPVRGPVFIWQRLPRRLQGWVQSQFPYRWEDRPDGPRPTRAQARAEHDGWMRDIGLAPFVSEEQPLPEPGGESSPDAGSASSNDGPRLTPRADPAHTDPGDVRER
jgi:hypothetical protein